jgi:DNA-binding PadR family transcriptional regulator
MKNDNNIERYHLTARDLAVVYLRFEKRMSGPKVALKLGITPGQMYYCLQKFNVKQYINDIVMPDSERKMEQLEQKCLREGAERVRQLRADTESNDPKRRKEALKELGGMYRRAYKLPKPMSDEELKKEIEEAVKRLGVNDNGENRT